MSDNEKPIREGISGRFVICHPNPEDPEVAEQRHRAACLLKATPRCGTCPNSKFTLYFDVPEKKLEQVKCPRWKSESIRHSGAPPEEYVVTELATCKEAPHGFCGSCPSKEELEKMHVDKSKDGWLARFNRFREEMRKADDDE